MNDIDDTASLSSIVRASVDGAVGLRGNLPRATHVTRGIENRTARECRERMPGDASLKRVARIKSGRWPEPEPVDDRRQCRLNSTGLNNGIESPRYRYIDRTVKRPRSEACIDQWRIERSFDRRRDLRFVRLYRSFTERLTR